MEGMIVPSGTQLTKQDIEEAVRGLSEEDASAVRKQFALGMVGLAIREKEVDVDGQGLREKLGRAVQAAAAADEKGLSVTETTTHDHGTGRTEFIVGNTDTAAKGKLNRAQRGEQDPTLYYVIIIAIAILIAAAIMS